MELIGFGNYQLVLMNTVDKGQFLMIYFSLLAKFVFCVVPYCVCMIQLYAFLLKLVHDA